VKALLSRRQEFKLQQLFPSLSPAKQVEVLFDVAQEGLADAYHYPWIVEGLLALDCDPATKHLLFHGISEQIANHVGKFEQRDRLLNRLRAAEP
jgi:hypothetical protein